MNPTPVSDRDFDELPTMFVKSGEWGVSTHDGALEWLRQYPLAKFERYVSDGPGYAGDLFFIGGGFPCAIVVFRDAAGKLVVAASTEDSNFDRR